MYMYLLILSNSEKSWLNTIGLILFVIIIALAIDLSRRIIYIGSFFKHVKKETAEDANNKKASNKMSNGHKEKMSKNSSAGKSTP